MEVLSIRIYRGPNPHGYRPMVMLELDLQELEAFPSNRLSTFTEDLIELVPTLREHECSYGKPGGFVQRLREGTWMGHVVEHLAIELQCLAGTPVTHGKTRSTGITGRYYVIYQYLDEELGCEAGHLAVKIIRSLLPAHLPGAMKLEERETFDPRRRLQEISRAYRRRTGPSTEALIMALEDLDIPWRRLNEFGLIQAGYGNRQKRLSAAITGDTSHISVDLAQDKELTNRMLHDAGLPVPRSILVHSEIEALEAARQLGYPIVIKPYDGHHGQAVTLRCMEPNRIGRGFRKAAKLTNSILVEKQLEGRDYRILVVKGEVVAVSERRPASVKGDGVRTLGELIEILNADPRRGEGHENMLSQIEIDEEVLEKIQEAGYSIDSIPPPGEVVYLKDTPNLSQGGTAVDRTDEIHSFNRQIAERAAGVVGLDVAGVDVVAGDISEPIHEGSGGIVEINAAPGLRMHLAPSEGKARPVAHSIIRSLFPDGRCARIPLISITGTNGKTTTTRMVAHVLKNAGYFVGMTTTDGIYMDGSRILKGDMTGPWSARLVLSDPRVEMAVLETARGGILREGLGFDGCDVGAVLNVEEDHLGLQGVEDLSDMAHLKRLVVEVVTQDGWSILNADDPLTRKMARYAGGKICWFSLDGSPAESSGRWVILSDVSGAPWICLREDDRELALLKTSDIPATFQGAARFNVANALAAVGICWSLGLSPTTIRQSLANFTSGFESTPGRLNRFDIDSFTVILDYAHNPAGLEALGDFISELPVSGRRLAVIGVPGDRRDLDLERFGKIAGRLFDGLIIREDRDLRGRKPLETATILKNAVSKSSNGLESLDIIPNEVEAVRTALWRAQPGDLVVCLIEDIEGIKLLVEQRQASTRFAPSNLASDQGKPLAEVSVQIKRFKTGTA